MITLKRREVESDKPSTSEIGIFVSKDIVYPFGNKSEIIKVWWNINKSENCLDWIGLFDANDSSFYLDQKSLRQHISPVVFTLTSKNLLNASEVYFGLIDGMTGRMLSKSKNIEICKSATLIFHEVKKPDNIHVYLNTNQGRVEIPKVRKLGSSKKNVTFNSYQMGFDFDFEFEDLHISLVKHPEMDNFDHFISANQLQNNFFQSKSFSHNYTVDIVFSIEPKTSRKVPNIMEIASSSQTPSESQWKTYVDAKKRKFYVNHVTKETRWTKPDILNNNSIEPMTPIHQKFADRSDSARNSFITPRRTIAIRSDGCPKNDLIHFFKRDEFKTALYENHEAMKIYNECSVVRHAIHRIQKDSDPPAKFENQPLFVRFANSFADVTQPLPSGWECISMNNRTVFLNHSNKETSFFDPRIRRFETKTTKRGRSVPSRSSNQIKNKIDHALISKCEDLRKIAQDNFPQIAERISKKLMLIERFGGLAVASLANDLDITLALSMLDSSTEKSKKTEEGDSIKLFYEEMKKEKLGKGPSRLCWKVSRDRLLDDAFRVILSVDPFVLKKSRLHIRFEGELALDYGGLSREFFILLSRELFHPNNGYFEYEGNDYHLQLRPRGCESEKERKWLTLCGKVLALAIIHRCYIDVFFSNIFYKCLQRKPIDLSDFQESDADFYKSMNWLLENDVDALEMSFVYSSMVNGKLTEQELLNGGDKKIVTNSNKTEFVELMCQKKSTRGIEKPLEIILESFSQILKADILNGMCSSELKRILSGSLELDLNDWRINTIYKGGYSDCHIVIEWFWEVIETMTNQERFDLLLFVTGSSSVPFEGFSALRGNDEISKFCIEKWGDATSLPRAHTCFNRLQLPSYNTKHNLKSKLQQAISNGMSYSIE
ncbi:hypothetical protein L5515_004583 [Caenorhabditis briggsae]|uniref:HECT-type E3 ubiquitin transferase n=3 Tax=Caenorhabditis briggsae TaxID=6238 RepID=A0AAE9EMA9_CAEBR|nr:hypothetical protein L3Y34_001738 [Caenorhabditis briggsae]UMM24274.1 hypothetical protein L5515_004583 [Caenorhabditis briggsae]